MDLISVVFTEVPSFWEKKMKGLERKGIFLL